MSYKEYYWCFSGSYTPRPHIKFQLILRVLDFEGLGVASTLCEIVAPDMAGSRADYSIETRMLGL